MAVVAIIVGLAASHRDTELAVVFLDTLAEQLGRQPLSGAEAAFMDQNLAMLWNGYRVAVEDVLRNFNTLFD